MMNRNEYAASVAGMFITTECVIVKKAEKKEAIIITSPDGFLYADYRSSDIHLKSR